MSNHYYGKNDSNVESNPKYINFEVANHKLKFKTDNGLFSKDRVDFGSMFLLESLTINSDFSTIVDIGCGYGVLGITIGKLHPNKEIYMVDVNDRAIKLSNENIKSNGITNVFAYESYLFQDVNINRCDIVVSNPPIRAGKSVVFSIIEESHARLVGDGELWFVIQKKQGAASSEKKMKELFNSVEVVATKKGYVVLKAKK